MNKQVIILKRRLTPQMLCEAADGAERRGDYSGALRLELAAYALDKELRKVALLKRRRV